MITVNIGHRPWSSIGPFIEMVQPCMCQAFELRMETLAKYLLLDLGAWLCFLFIHWPRAVEKSYDHTGRGLTGHSGAFDGLPCVWQCVAVT